MSRRAYDDIDGAWSVPEDRRATAAAMLAKAGIDTRPGPAAPPPVPKVTRDRLAALEARDGFLHPAGGAFAISPTLAAMLHYREPAVTSFPASNEGAKSIVPDDLDTELASLEAARRG